MEIPNTVNLSGTNPHTKSMLDGVHLDIRRYVVLPAITWIQKGGEFR